MQVHSTAGLLWGIQQNSKYSRPLLWGEYSSGLEKHTKWLLEQNGFAKIKVLAQRDSLFPKSTGSAGSLLKLILLTAGACLRGLCRAAARPHPKAGAPAAGLAAGFCAGLAGQGQLLPPYGHGGRGGGLLHSWCWGRYCRLLSLRSRLGCRLLRLCGYRRSCISVTPPQSCLKMVWPESHNCNMPG